MRPIQIEMTNFGPYRHEIINFEQLTQDPVFLISGDTGSGKSMIFDAMTVALFYSTASDRDVKSLRSSFATPEDPETEITFYFEHSDHIYCIHRVIEQEVKKVRGKGTRKKTQEADLTLVDRPGGEVLDKIASKPNNVGPAINDLLQMNAEQFKQIILLPQNKFSEFLKANTKDKVPILRTIFGTQIFDRFMEKLSERQKLANERRKERSAQFNILFQDKLWENVAEQLAQTPEQEKISVIETNLEDNKTQLEKLEQTYLVYQTELDQLEKELRQAQKINEQFNQLHVQEDEYQKKILAKQSDYKEELKQRQELEFAKERQVLVQNIEQSKQAIVEDEERLKAVEESLELNLGQKQVLTQEQDRLNERKEDLINLPNEIKQWNLNREKARQIESLNQQLSLKKEELKGLVASKEQAESQFETLKTSFDGIKVDEQIEKTLLTKDSQLHHFEDVFANRIVLRQKELESQKEGLKVEEDKIKQLRSSIAQLNEVLDKLSQDLEVKKADRRALMVAQLRKELVDGEACVVCGSKEHPFAHDEVQADELALKDLLEEVEVLETKLAQHRSQLSQEEAHLKHQEKLVTDGLKKIEETETELQKVLKQFADDLVSSLFEVTVEKIVDAGQIRQLLKSLTVTLSQEHQEYDNLKHQKQELEQSLDHQEKLVQDLRSSLSTEEALKDKLESDIKAIMIKVPTLEKVERYDKWIASGEKSLKDYETDLEIFNQKQQKILLAERELVTKQGELIERLNKTRDNLVEYSRQLEEELSKEQALTDDEQVLRTWISQLNQLERIIASLTSYETTKANLEQTITRLKKALDGQVETNVNHLEVNLELKTKEQKERLVEKTALSQRLQQQEERYQQLKDLLDEEADARDELAAIDNLANFVKGGATGQVRLNLVTYVLREYLQEVIQYANHRFYKELTDGRYILELHDVEGAGSGQVGLDIDVRDIATDVSRSVRTLSGGETFITSLAIALSLSEIVQSKTNGATIEALFVDEGFGTLDKEALDRAMTALEDVGQNKMVGVISHVEEMKSRIGQQLQVTKHTDGSSELAVHSFY